MATGRRLARVTTIAIGIIALVCAALGLLYNANSLGVAWRGGFGGVVAEQNLRRFYRAFYVMSATCITFYVLLSWCGLQLLRLRSSAVWPFTILMIVEVVYFLATAVIGFARVGDIDGSVAGAFGVANGGLIVQFAILFPLWGPACAIWARHRIA